MSRLTRDGTAEPVSRDQILRHARGQGNVHFPCSADHEQDWQPYPVDPYSTICDDHTYIHTYTQLLLAWPTPTVPRRDAISLPPILFFRSYNEVFVRTVFIPYYLSTDIDFICMLCIFCSSTAEQGKENMIQLD